MYIAKLLVYLKAGLNAQNRANETALNIACSNTYCPQQSQDILKNPKKIKSYCSSNEVADFEQIQQRRNQ